MVLVYLRHFDTTSMRVHMCIMSTWHLCRVKAVCDSLCSALNSHKPYHEGLVLVLCYRWGKPATTGWVT